MGSKQAKIIRKELRKAGIGTILAGVSQEAKDELAKAMYNKLMTSLKPRPKWMPKFVHTYLISILLEVRTNETDREHA